MSDQHTAFDRLQSKVQQYVRAADQIMLEHMRLTVFEVVVGVLRSKDFRGDIPKAVETACKVCAYLYPLAQPFSTSQHHWHLSCKHLCACACCSSCCCLHSQHHKQSSLDACCQGFSAVNKSAIAKASPMNAAHMKLHVLRPASLMRQAATCRLQSASACQYHT